MANYYNKYRAKKTEIDGLKFDSQKEAFRYQFLTILQRAGEIEDLKIQVPYTLVDKSKYGREIKYIADFTYKENGKLVVEDVKGVRTPVYILKKRLMAERYGIIVKET